MFIIGLLLGLFLGFVPMAIYLDLKCSQVRWLEWDNETMRRQLTVQSELFEAGYGQRVWPESDKERVRD